MSDSRIIRTKITFDVSLRIEFNPENFRNARVQRMLLYQFGLALIFHGGGVALCLPLGFCHPSP